MKKVELSSKCAKMLGRIYYHEGICELGYSASEAGFLYDGDVIKAQIITDHLAEDEAHAHGFIGVIVGDDEEPYKRFEMTTPEAEYLIFDREEYAKAKGVAVDALAKNISVRMIKYNEVAFGRAGVRWLLIDDNATMTPLPEKKLKLEFIGDSITCGYGVEGVWNVDLFTTAQENPMKAYAVQTSKRLNADYQLVSWSGIGLISDWIPPEVDEPDTTILSTELYPYTNFPLCKREGWEQEPWDAKKFIPNAVVIHLGTNDASYTRNKPERNAHFVSEYRRLYKMVRDNYGAGVPIVCCLGLMDRILCPVIAELVQELNKEGDANVHWVEFEGQLEEDGIGADWHPSEITHHKAADKLAAFIKEIL